MSAVTERIRAAHARYWELTDEGVRAIDSAVQSNRSKRMSVDDAVRDVAATLGEDWRVVLACYRSVEPLASHPNPIAQDSNGKVRRTLRV